MPVYVSSNKWIDCGQLPFIESLYGMAVFDGNLYVTSMYRPGLYRYDGNSWWDCGQISDESNKQAYSLRFIKENYVRHSGKAVYIVLRSEPMDRFWTTE